MVKPLDSTGMGNGKRAAALRGHLADLIRLASGRSRPVPPAALVSRRYVGPVLHERVILLPDPASPVPGLFLRPAGGGASPAVLFLHSHGHHYDTGKEEMLEKGGGAGALVKELLDSGIAVFGIDSLCFGARKADEAVSAKRLFWKGDSLFAAMVRDECAAFEYLRSREDVMRARIGCAGFSMGGTKALWLAAVDPRVRAAACVCALTTYHALLRKQFLSRHEWYFFLPGILAVADLDEIASLIAPRPLFCLNAAGDDKAPVEGFRRAKRTISAAYGGYGREGRGCFHARLIPGPHRFTPAMGRQVARWLGRNLLACRPTPPRGARTAPSGPRTQPRCSG